MARCLIVGCGCRGRALAAELVARGHTVRGTSRQAAALGAIEAAGAEAVLADPDRVATLIPALDHVAVAVLLLGAASGPPEEVAALHGSRLEMLLSRMLDTTIHGIVYEVRGNVDAALLREGGKMVRRVCEGSRIPFALLDAEPGGEHWAAEAVAAVEGVLGSRG